jgi:HAD superfamily hydrolase (TIGR01490 family)
METTFSNGINTSVKYIAFFDLDRTIISTNSGRTLFKHSYKNGLITTTDLMRGIYLSFVYKFGLKDTSEIIAGMVKWMKGLPEYELNELSTEVFNQYLLKSIRSEVSSEIGFHKSRGAKTVILSSAIFPVCINVARYLGMDDVVCSNLEIIEGVYTGRSYGPLCFDKEKTVRLIEYCKNNGINPLDSWYYGDSISDLAVLSCVGNPVCINPDKKLKKAALKRGWKTIFWH